MAEAEDGGKCREQDEQEGGKARCACAPRPRKGPVNKGLAARAQQTGSKAAMQWHGEGIRPHGCVLTPFLLWPLPSQGARELVWGFLQRP